MASSLALLPHVARAANGGAATLEPAPVPAPPVAGALGGAGGAAAPVTPAGQATATAPTPARWYGYQLILADAASLSIGLASDRVEPMAVGYLAAPIVVHALHRRTSAAVLSPLMRVFLPLIGAAIGSNFKHCNAYGDECEFRGAFTGGGIGIAAALILDWSALAWTKPTPSSAPPGDAHQAGGSPHAARPTGFRFTAAGFAPTRSGVGVALGGIF